MSLDRDSYQMFYDIIPHVLRDDELQPHLRQLFEWYRRLDTWALDESGAARPHQAQSEPLAVLTVAMTDGLALQALADPDLDLAPAFALWRRLVLDCVKTSARHADAGRGRSSPPRPSRSELGVRGGHQARQLRRSVFVERLRRVVLEDVQAALARHVHGVAQVRPVRGELLADRALHRLLHVPPRVRLAQEVPAGPTASITSSASVSSSSSRSRKALAARR